MFYHIETEERTVGGRTGTVYSFNHNGGARAEIWPAHGFNCLRWQIRIGDSWRDLLYAAPDWDANPVPTRSGIPILFPFPNRIRDGKFKFGGKEFQLPQNDSAKMNAIHGFAPRHPWRVFGYSFDEQAAWIHGDFQASIDAPETLDLWPSDYILSVIYRFTTNSLRLESRVKNAGSKPLPFGLGFHPYLRFPSGDDTIDRCKLLAPARSLWESIESLPTGKKQPVSDNLNWNSAKRVAGSMLDTLYTDLGAIAERPDGLLLRAELAHTELPGALQLWTSGDFGEAVLFTPPHRQAICIEPYTCATDAINLATRKIDAGWRILQPDEVWTSVVEFRWEPSRDV